MGGGYDINQLVGNVWVTAPGGAVQISVAADGDPWITNDAGIIYSADFTN